MIYLLAAVVFWLFLLLFSKKELLSRTERRKRRLQLIEYAGAAAICALMLDAIFTHDDTGWYPWIVLALLAAWYGKKLLEWVLKR